jgi:hypothetical protein
MNIRPGIVYIQARNRDQKRKVYAKSHQKPPNMQLPNERGNKSLCANK